MKYEDLQNKLSDPPNAVHASILGYAVRVKTWTQNGRILSGRATPENIAANPDNNKTNNGDIEHFLSKREAVDFLNKNHPYSEITAHKDKSGETRVRVVEYSVAEQRWDWDAKEKTYEVVETLNIVCRSKMTAAVETIAYVVQKNIKHFDGDLSTDPEEDNGILSVGCAYAEPDRVEKLGVFDDAESALQYFNANCPTTEIVHTTKDGGAVTTITEYFIIEETNKIEDTWDNCATIQTMILVVSKIPAPHFSEKKPFSDQLKAARKKIGYSQKTLSAALGIPRRTIENWESGQNQPAAWTAELLLEKLFNMYLEQIVL